MKKLLLVVCGIICLTIFTKHFIVSAICQDVPEQEARVAVIDQQMARLKTNLGNGEELEKNSIREQLDILNMEAVILSYSLQSSRYYMEIGLFKLIYLAMKNQFTKGYFLKIHFADVYQKIKDTSCEFCNDEFKAAFKQMLEQLQAGSLDKVAEAEKNLHRIFKEKKKATGESGKK